MMTLSATGLMSAEPPQLCQHMGYGRGFIPNRRAQQVSHLGDHHGDQFLAGADGSVATPLRSRVPPVTVLPTGA